MGNSLEGIVSVSTPEIVGIGFKEDDDALSTFTFLHKELEIYNDVWDYSIYGMVGTIFEEDFFICGGVTRINRQTTNRCQTFSLKTYEWQESNITMNEHRSFGHALSFPNGTFAIFGGSDIEGKSLNSTEHLSLNLDAFLSGPDLPERFSHHCVSLVNETHMFIAGGLQAIPIARGMK